jgi:hypothetical protein
MGQNGLGLLSMIEHRRQPNLSSEGPLKSEVGLVISKLLSRSSNSKRLWRALACIGFFLLLGLSAQAQSSLNLAWDPSPNASVTGYRIYRGAQSRNYSSNTDVGGVTKTTVSGLTAGTTYFFTVTGYDAQGQESDYSNEITYTAPVGTNTPPSIALTSPVNGARYAAPATVNLAANVTANGHTITKVQFYNGATLLGEDASAPYAFTWANVSPGSYSVTGRVVYDTGITLNSAGVSLTVTNGPAGSGLTFAADSGTITAPFVASGGNISQASETGVTDGGRAAYNFTITKPGDYSVSALVNAPNENANSFFINIDAEPTDPLMIWDVPLTSGLTSQTVSWRGNGTAFTNQFSPKTFTLSAGAHQLIVRGREPNVQLGTITITSLATNTPQPPDLALVSPVNRSVYAGPANVNLLAAVTPWGHTISKVQFYGNGVLLVEDLGPPYTGTWSNVSAGSYTVLARAVYDNGSYVDAACDITVTNVTTPPPSTITFASDSGSITAPFTALNGLVSQAIETGVTTGGRAAYTFNVTSAGNYTVSALVNAPNENANSLFVNIDSEPTDPFMIWDIPITSGLTSRAVSWRGNGSPLSNQFVPRVFTLSAGSHQLIVRGREPNVQLGAISIVPVPPLPAPWQSTDIGTVGSAGSAGVLGSAYAVSGAGTLSGSADSFRFAYQTLSADGEISLQISSMDNLGTNGCVGVMIRESLLSGSPYAFMGVSSSSAFRWQHRANTGTPASNVTNDVGVAPNIWVRLVRTGKTLFGYQSTDGVSWSELNSMSISMASQIYVGIAVASGSSAALGTAMLNNVSVTP